MDQAKALSLRNGWMKALETSVTVPRGPDAMVTSSDMFNANTLVAAGGWILAVAFFLGLLSLHLKVRRREKLLRRGSRPDIFLYTKRDRDRRGW